MRRGILKVLLHSAPDTPAADRWTKLGPCLDVAVPSLLAHDSFGESFRAMGIKHDMVDQNGDHEAEADYLVDTPYEAV